MKLTAHGAARNVTGSKHVLTVGRWRVLLDCGLFQGRRVESNRRNRRLPFAAAGISSVLLSHAHIDHAGSLPTLTRSGFRGRIFATHATVDLAKLLLTDAAFVQEQDIEYLNKRRKRRGEPPLEPIYTQRDVEEAAEHFVGVDYDEPTRVAPGVTATFREAGHILGSSVIEIEACEHGRKVRIVFTGDLGRSGTPILRDPHRPRSADVLVTESTYGGRRHAPDEHVARDLAALVSDVARRKGKVIIPSFAVGRTQRIVYELHELARSGRIPEVPIFVDSPLAVRATEIFRRHPECFDAEMNDLIGRDDDPLGFSRVTYVTKTEESKKLNRRPGPIIVVSASGMCEAGRILHHLKNTISGRRNAVVITGYQASHTLGRRLAEGVTRVRIHGDYYRVRARVAVFNEFSAHADRDELLEFASTLRPAPRRTIVVHGSEDQALAFGRLLDSHGFGGVAVPVDGESIEL